MHEFLLDSRLFVFGTFLDVKLESCYEKVLHESLRANLLTTIAQIESR